MYAIPIGMIQAANAADAMRAIVSAVRLWVTPHSATNTQAPAQATTTIGYLPKRSPIGPMKSCIEPCTSE